MNRVTLRMRCNPVTEFESRRRFLSQATAIRKLVTARLARLGSLLALVILFGSRDVHAETQNEVDIRLTPNFPHQQAEQELLARGAEIQDSSDYFDRISCRIDSSHLEELGAQPWVVAIQPRPIPTTQNDGSRATIDVDLVQAPPWGSSSNPHNLTGAGVKAGIWDQGQPGVPITVGVPNTPAHADLAGRWFPEELGGPFSDFHHTHVAGTMAGDGSQSAGQGGTALQWAGMAPQAEVHTWDFSGSVFTEMLNAVLAGKINESQNSWAYLVTLGSYIFQCGEADKLVWDKKLPIFFAAGNYQASIVLGFGSVSAPGTAKNVVAVGAVTKSDTMTGFSSWGPTLDGRLKPDVVAAGASIKSCGNSGASNYTTLSGTSMACPAVSGLGALLIEKYRQLNAGNYPDPALLKAILCNCATDQIEPQDNPGPDFKFGYGKVNAVEAANNLQNADYLYEATGISTGVTHTYYLDVPAGCVNDLKVMLVWSDREYTGAGSNNATLINDLDLELLDPGASLPRLPLTLDPTVGNQNNPAVPQANHRDNVEQVVVAAPAPGLWTISVHGFNVPQGPQPYALTWFDPQNCMGPPPPPCEPPPSGMVAWYTGDDTTPVDHLAQHDGTFVGSPISSSDWKVGGGALAVFPSPATYVVVPGGPNFGTGDFSIDMWIRTASATAVPGVQPILDKRTTSPLVGYHLALYNGYLLAQLADGVGGGSTNYLNTNNAGLFVADGQWHFVAVTVDRTSPVPSLVLYVDNNVQSFSPVQLGNLSNPADLWIGARQTGLGGGYFDGLLDEIEFYDVALDPTDVDRIRLADSGGKCKCTDPPADMVAWWPLDEGSGATSLEDIVGGNDAVPSASPVDGTGAPRSVPGVVDGAIEFPKFGNGFSGARVTPSVGLNNIGSADFTLDAWVKFDPGSPANEPHYIVNKFDTTTSKGYAFYITSPGIPNNERLEFKWGAGPGSSNSVQTISSLAPDQWYFVAVAVTRNVGGSALDIRLYVNGIQQGAQFVGNPVGSMVNSLTLEIGWQPSTIDEPIALDELEIFERALNGNEILRIYRADGHGKCKGSHIPPPLVKSDDDKCIGGATNGQPCAQNSDCAGGGACQLKNRFLSVEVSEDATSHGIKVTLVSLGANSVAAPGNYNGTGRWVGPPQLGISDGVSPPFNAARLQCEPYSQDWSEVGQLHIYGDVVVPDSLYDVSTCDADSNCSAPLRIATARFGDIVAPLSSPNFQDIVAIVDKFQNKPTGPSKTRVKLREPVDPETPVGFLEVSAGVSAFQGKTYRQMFPTPPMTCP